jgi:hypothetical protein
MLSPELADHDGDDQDDQEGDDCDGYKPIRSHPAQKLASASN